MNKAFASAMGALSLFVGGNVFSATAKKPHQVHETHATCKWSDLNKAKDHFTNHVTYPINGKQAKNSCKKEASNEFTANENACIDSIPDGVEYKTPQELMKAAHL